MVNLAESELSCLKDDFRNKDYTYYLE